MARTGAATCQRGVRAARAITAVLARSNEASVAAVVQDAPTAPQRGIAIRLVVTFTTTAANAFHTMNRRRSSAVRYDPFTE